MKKSLALTLSVLLILGCFAFAVSAENSKALRFNDDGSFKILQLADLQDGVLFRELTATFIIDLLEKEQPDLVVLTGDNIAPGACLTYGATWISINKFMSIFEERNVPVAIVYGNHDDDGNILSKEQQWKIYEEYDCFVGVADSEELSGYGTYYLPILASDSDEQKFTLWFFDSQTYNEDEEVGGYGCVEKDQIDWYVRTETALKEANGGEAIPSFAFQHIIVPEIYDTFYKLWETDPETGNITIIGDPAEYKKELIVEFNNTTYLFPEEHLDDDSFIGETCCPPNYSNGQADALVDTGNVLGIAVGHDHVNSFVVPYRGMDIVQTPTASFGSYGDMNRGARVITLNESDLSTYETDVIFFRDYYDLSDEELYNRFVFNSDSSDYTSTDRFVAMIKYIFLKMTRLLSSMFAVSC